MCNFCSMFECNSSYLMHENLSHAYSRIDITLCTIVSFCVPQNKIKRKCKIQEGKKMWHLHICLCMYLTLVIELWATWMWGMESCKLWSCSNALKASTICSTLCELDSSSPGMTDSFWMKNSAGLYDGGHTNPWLLEKNICRS